MRTPAVPNLHPHGLFWYQARLQTSVSLQDVFRELRDFDFFFIIGLRGPCGGARVDRSGNVLARASRPRLVSSTALNITREGCPCFGALRDSKRTLLQQHYVACLRDWAKRRKKKRKMPISFACSSVSPACWTRARPRPPTKHGFGGCQGIPQMRRLARDGSAQCRQPHLLGRRILEPQVSSGRNDVMSWKRTLGTYLCAASSAV